MSRDLEHKTQPAGNENVQSQTADQDVGSTTKFSAGGPLPPVAGGDAQVGPSASERAFGAADYARGNDIHFGNQAADPHMAHEASHVVQQREGRVQASEVGGMPVNTGQGLEKEAEATAAKYQ